MVQNRVRQQLVSLGVNCGCQMLERKPLFPGHNTQHQLQAGRYAAATTLAENSGMMIGWFSSLIGAKPWCTCFGRWVTTFLATTYAKTMDRMIGLGWLRNVGTSDFFQIFSDRIRIQSEIFKCDLAVDHQLCWQAGARGVDRESSREAMVPDVNMCWPPKRFTKSKFWRSFFW